MPYEWAKALSNYIVDRRLITLKVEGYTGYGRGSAFADQAVDVYLISGTIPLRRVRCRS